VARRGSAGAYGSVVQGRARSGRLHGFSAEQRCGARRDSGRAGAGPGAFSVPCLSAPGGARLRGRYKVSPVGVSVGEHRPNKRLKLAGALVSKEAVVLCPWRGTDCRPLHLALAGGSPAA